MIKFLFVAAVLGDSWQSLHPSDWSPDDVLAWVYDIAEVRDDIDETLLSGESFYISGKQLCTMTAQDFIERDTKFGLTLYKCFKEIYSSGRYIFMIFGGIFVLHFYENLNFTSHIQRDFPMLDTWAPEHP